MSDKAVIAILIFILLVVGFVCIRYDDEVRALLGRLERFRADRRGIESTFSPAREPTLGADGLGAAPETEDTKSDFEKSSPAAEQANAADLQAEGNLDVLHREMVRALIAGETEQAKEARARFRVVADDEVEVAKADALFDALTFDKTGDPDDFKRLQEKAVDARITAYVEHLTGMVLENVKRPAEAADAYSRAVAASTKPGFRADMLANRARLLIETHQTETAEHEIKAALRAESDPVAKATLWKALARTHGAQKQRLDQAIALQEARQHEPNNSDLCFQIAWALGQSERTDTRSLAVHFYRLAIYLDPKNQYAQNNLGWEYSQADLSIQAATHYKKAADLSNSLAMANLAGVKLRAGLVEEAEELLKNAQEQEDVHENVASLLVDSGRARAEQASKASELDKNGAQLAEFCSRTAQAELQDGPSELPTRWRWSSGGPVVSHLWKAKLILEWEEKKAKHKIEAEVRGRSARGDQYTMGSRYSYTHAEEVETDWEKKRAVLLTIEGADCIKVVFLKDGGSEFRSLRPDGSATD